MAPWKRRLTRFASSVDSLSDKLRFRIKKRLNLFDAVQVCPYDSYGNSKELNVFGRVLENKGIKRAEADDTIWENIINMYRRFESDEIPGAVLRLHFHGKEYETVSNAEGYFNAVIIPEFPLTENGWEELEVEIIKAPVPLPDPPWPIASARIRIPGPLVEFGIISDIDDTVIESFATSKLKMMRTVMLKNAHTRLPFEGVAAFYRALEGGLDGKRHNPIFYVSSSPWNLYDFLEDFMEVHGLPAGPLLLKDNGIDNDQFLSKGHMAHKYVQIEKILNTYPEMSFILIGDSGQKDPVVYQEVVKKFPGRIKAIYIRDVKLPERAKIVIDVAKEMEATMVPMILVENTVKAAEHAVQSGYIPASAMAEIEVAKAMDNSAEVDAAVKKAPEEVKAETKEKMQDEVKKEEVHEPVTSNDPGVSEGKVAQPVRNGESNSKS